MSTVKQIKNKPKRARALIGATVEYEYGNREITQGVITSVCRSTIFTADGKKSDWTCWIRSDASKSLEQHSVDKITDIIEMAH